MCLVSFPDSQYGARTTREELGSKVNIYTSLCCSGFYTGGGWNFTIPSPSPPPPPPPRNLEIEYGYYCGAINISYLILHVTGIKYMKVCP